MDSSTDESHSPGNGSTAALTDVDPPPHIPIYDEVVEIFNVLMTIDYPEDSGSADDISNMLAVFSQIQTNLLPYHMLRESHRLEILHGLEDVSLYLDGWQNNLQLLIDERESARQYLPHFPTAIDSTEYIPGTLLRTAIARWREKMPPTSKKWAKEGKLMDLIQQFYFKSVYQPYMDAFEVNLDANAKSLEPELSKVTYKLQVLCGFLSRLNSLVDHMTGQYQAAKDLLKNCPEDLREPYNKYKADLREADVVIARLKEQNQAMQERLQLRAGNLAKDSGQSPEEPDPNQSGKENAFTARSPSDRNVVEQNPSQARTPRRFNHLGLKLTIPTTPWPGDLQMGTSASSQHDPNLVTSPTDDGVEIDHMVVGIGNLAVLQNPVSTLEQWVIEHSTPSEKPEQGESQPEEPESDEKDPVSEELESIVEPSTPPQAQTGDMLVTHHSPQTPLSSMRGGEASGRFRKADSASTPPDASRDLSFASDHSTSARSFRQMIRDLTSSGDNSRRRNHSRRGQVSRKPTM